MTWARGGRAPTRGAPTVGLFARARGRAPTRGAPTVGLLGRARARGRAPTRGAPTDGLPDVVGDVVFGAEVEDVLFVFVVLFVGVEGVYANSFYVRQVVDFDAFAVERVEAVVDGSLIAMGIFCGQFGEGGDPGAETRLSFSANKVDLESIFYFTELDRCGGVEDDAIGGQSFDKLVLGKGLVQGERAASAASAASAARRGRGRAATAVCREGAFIGAWWGRGRGGVCWCWCGCGCGCGCRLAGQ